MNYLKYEIYKNNHDAVKYYNKIIVIQKIKKT